MRDIQHELRADRDGVEAFLVKGMKQFSCVKDYLLTQEMRNLQHRLNYAACIIGGRNCKERNLDLLEMADIIRVNKRVCLDDPSHEDVIRRQQFIDLLSA